MKETNTFVIHLLQNGGQTKLRKMKIVSSSESL